MVGCGAVTRTFHLPAALQIEEVEISALIDPDETAARRCAALAGCDGVFSDWRDAVRKIDAAVVATPPSTHAEIVIGLLENGVDVLCEKPFAPTSAQARRMIETARRNGRHLAVGMMRRLFPNMIAVKKLLDSSALGELVSVTVEEGDEFSWPVDTPYLFQAAPRAGVLLDTGVHALDCLVWWFGEDIEVARCRDDGWNGPAANAVVDLLLSYAGGKAPCRVVLSNDRRTSNILMIEGSRATLKIDPIGSLNAPTVVGDAFLAGVSWALRCDGQTAVRDMPGAFVEQIRRLVDARCGRETSYVSAADAGGAVSIIERCRRVRTPMSPGPWVPFSGTNIPKEAPLEALRP